MQKSAKFIILKRMKWSEADLIVHALETNGQRLNLLARGALKSKKRFGGGILEPTHFLEGQIKLGKSEDSLSILEDARLLEGFEGLRADYDRLTLALKILDAVDRSNPGEHFPEIFNLLGNTLKKLSEGCNLGRLECQFLLKFLKLNGVLEFENWMATFLEKPIAAQDADFPPSSHAKIAALHEKVKLFVAGHSLG